MELENSNENPSITNNIAKISDWFKKNAKN